MSKTCRVVDVDADCLSHFQYAGIVFLSLFGDWWRLAAAAAMAALAQLWHASPEGTQKLIIAATIIFTLDIVTGVLRAVLKREPKKEPEGFSSDRFGCSVTKAAVYLCALTFGVAADAGLQLGSVWVTGIVTLIFLREASSVIENLALLGFHMPEFLTKHLSAMRENVCGGNDDIENGV